MPTEAREVVPLGLDTNPEATRHSYLLLSLQAGGSQRIAQLFRKKYIPSTPKFWGRMGKFSQLLNHVKIKHLCDLTVKIILDHSRK